MLAHGHTMESVAAIPADRMANITQMWVDGQINGRAQTDMLVYIYQGMMAQAGVKNISSYKDILPLTFQYLDGNPAKLYWTEEEIGKHELRVMLFEQMKSGADVPQELLDAVKE